MKIIAKRPFISSKQGLGNVSEGRVMDVEDNYARMLIKSGLAEERSAAPIIKAERQTSFMKPVEANLANGLSSQAAPVSQIKTVTRSKSGARKTRAAK
jgi:hypothetical protein